MRIIVSLLGISSIILLGTLYIRTTSKKTDYYEQVIAHEDRLKIELKESLRKAYSSDESFFITTVVTEQFIDKQIAKLELLSNDADKENLGNIMEDIRGRYSLKTSINGFFDPDLINEDRMDYGARLQETVSLEDLSVVEKQFKKIKQEGDAFHNRIELAIKMSKNLIQVREKDGNVLMDVPSISQLPELPTGCEITAITMMLQYKGVDKGAVQLANEMARHASDPDLGYVGNPFTKSGWTVHPQGVLELIKTNAGNAQNLTGIALEELENKLAQETPVVAWMTMHGFTVHAITLIGFDSEYIFYNDPWTGGGNLKMTREAFMKNWKLQDYRAVSI